LTHSTVLIVSGSCPNNSFPAHLQGEWYSIDQGEEMTTLITPRTFTIDKIVEDARCHDLRMIEGTMDAQGHYDAKVLLYNQ